MSVQRLVLEMAIAPYNSIQFLLNKPNIFMVNLLPSQDNLPSKLIHVFFSLYLVQKRKRKIEPIPQPVKYQPQFSSYVFSIHMPLPFLIVAYICFSRNCEELFVDKQARDQLNLVKQMTADLLDHSLDEVRI